MNQKKQTFNVLFWIRKGRTNEKLSPLSCRVTISGQRYEIPTKLHLRSESWSAVAQKSLGKTANDKEANRYIEDLKITIEDTVTKIRQKNYPLNIENFKLMFQTQDNEFSTISTLFDYHEIMEKKNLRASTFVGYHVTKKHLLNFIRIKYHVSDYDLTAIDKAFVYEFYAYLQGYKREGDTVCAVNGALKHIQRFKKVMNVALQNEWISRNPVCLLNAKKTKVEHRGSPFARQPLHREGRVRICCLHRTVICRHQQPDQCKYKCRYRQKLVAELLSSENGHTRHATFVAACCLYIKEV